MTLAGWVRIEAVLKADGRGLRVDPARVRFADDAQGTVAWIEDERPRYRVVDVELGRYLVVALARREITPTGGSSIPVDVMHRPGA
jgi:4'-phosphopantetheinyl transferase